MEQHSRVSGETRACGDLPPSDWRRLRERFAKKEKENDATAPLRELHSRRIYVQDSISDAWQNDIDQVAAQLGYPPLDRCDVNDYQQDQQLRGQVSNVLDLLRKSDLRINNDDTVHGTDDEERSLLAQRAKLLFQREQQREHATSEYSSWVRRIEQKFHEDADKDQSSSSMSRKADARRRHSESENRPLRMNTGKSPAARNTFDAYEHVQRIAIRELEPTMKRHLNNDEALARTLSERASVPNQEGKHSLFQWETEHFPRTRDELPHSTSRSPLQSSRPEPKRAPWRPSQLQKTGVLRLEARRELRVLRITFANMLAFAEKQRAVREASHTLILSRHWLRVQSRQKKRCFRKFSHHARFVSRLRMQATQRRFFQHWVSYAGCMRTSRVNERLKHARKERVRLFIQHADVRRHAQVLERVWAIWKALVLRHRARRAEIRLQEARNEQKRRFKEKLRREQQQRQQAQYAQEQQRQRDYYELESQKRHQQQVQQHPCGGTKRGKLREQTSEMVSRVRKPPPPPPSPPQEVLAMQERARERKARREELRKRLEELELMRREEAAQREFEKNLQVVEARAAKLAKRKQEMVRREEIQKARESRAQLSALHCERAKLWYHGLKPWKILVRIAQINFERAQTHYRRALLQRQLRHWHGVTRSIALVRRKREKAMDNAAVHFRRRALLRLGWRCIALRHARLQAKGAAIQSSWRMFSRHEVWRKWQLAVQREQHRADSARRFAARTLQKRIWSRWMSFVHGVREARTRTAGKNQIWSRVRDWLAEDDILGP